MFGFANSDIMLPPKLRMASSSSSTCFLCNFHNIPSLKSPTSKSPSTLTTNFLPHCSAPLRLRASPPNKIPTTTTDDDNSLDQTPPSKPSSLLPNFRNGWFKFDELGMDMLSIALPAAVALAADPIASLIDTAFVGHIGTFLANSFYQIIVISVHVSVSVLRR